MALATFLTRSKKWCFSSLQLCGTRGWAAKKHTAKEKAILFGKLEELGQRSEEWLEVHLAPSSQKRLSKPLAPLGLLRRASPGAGP